VETMTAMKAGSKEVISLPPYNTITITVSGVGSGSIERMGNNPGEQSFGVVAVSANTVIGPFSVQTRHLLRCTQPAMSYDVAPADFPTASSGVQNITTLSQAQSNALTPDSPPCRRPIATSIKRRRPAL
ncbi:hypothetical protein, partial [Mesorhizobium sp. M5C.F.Ca.ET.164.01.1.1]|uniref:hypothetical protein n=1 Tax=Mesorhizobium sp. M5C.F.Ca.ET.164.01.1.1 TaxID=2563957 RepID=UPI001AEE4498